MTRSGIRFEKVTKRYGALTVVKDLDLTIGSGEFVSLLGPSGSGKTTLLMMLAGFEDVSEGRILIDGTPVNDVPSWARDMGVVFQSYALFPHLDVGRNVAFPLEMRGIARAEIARRVDQALDMVQLLPLKRRKPSELSGGQQQRVALARALVFEPGVVLMDEPLGALDKQLREQMQLDIRALHRRLGVTIVFVTHDQHEALTMSDRIAVFDKGRIQQIGTPREIFDRPTNRFVAEFIGETNLLEGHVEMLGNDTALLVLPGGERLPGRAGPNLAAKGRALASLRPERLRLTDSAMGISGTVTDTVYQGSHLRVDVATSAGPLIAHLTRSVPEPDVGQSVTLTCDEADCWILAP